MTHSAPLLRNTTDPADRRGSRSQSGYARPQRQTVLAYHELSSEAAAYQYTLNRRQFEDHVRLACLLGDEGASGDQPVAISFDDGHISNYTCALPILEKYSYKAIFFVIAGRIGQRNDFMTWKHLEDLVRRGHRVEAHGWSHVFLTTCNDQELETELKRSKQTIEDRLGTPVSALSAPHGRWNARVLRACGEAGYRHLYTSNPWGGRGPEQSVQVRGRLVAVQSLDADRLRRWLTMGRADAALYRAKQNLKDSVQKVLGDKLYYQLWSRFSGWKGPDDYKA
jgi:peptidoglycan/xylan/chitin deacetylase (PgdA/CDA1 family)